MRPDVGISVHLLTQRVNQGTGAMINLSAYYIFGIPLGLYLAFPLNGGLIGLWEGLTLSLIYASIVSLWLVLRTDWQREVQKVLDRFEKERQQSEDEHARSAV